MVMQNSNISIRPALFAAALLSIPLFGVVFGAWQWGWPPFAVFGTILFSAGLAYEFAGSNAKAGVFGGLVFGFLIAACVIATLRILNPEEDPAGIVIITFLFCGIFFAFVGYFVQRYFKRG